MSSLNFWKASLFISFVSSGFNSAVYNKSLIRFSKSGMQVVPNHLIIGDYLDNHPKSK